MKAPILATAAFLATLFSVPQDRQAGGSAVAEEGKPAPTLRLNDHEGNLVAIGGEAERWTVLAFYPKAMTPG